MSTNVMDKNCFTPLYDSMRNVAKSRERKNIAKHGEENCR